MATTAVPIFFSPLRLSPAASEALFKLEKGHRIRVLDPLFPYEFMSHVFL